MLLWLVLSLLLPCDFFQKTGTIMQEEVETSACDAVAGLSSKIITVSA